MWLKSVAITSTFPGPVHFHTSLPCRFLPCVGICVWISCRPHESVAIQASVVVYVCLALYGTTETTVATELITTETTGSY